jgi:hypothetical protein
MGDKQEDPDHHTPPAAADTAHEPVAGLADVNSEPNCRRSSGIKEHLALQKTLDDLAADLTRPEKCGIFLPRKTIMDLCEQHNLAPYHGLREEMLRGLFRGALAAGELSSVIESLLEIVTEKLDAYRVWMNRYPAARKQVEYWVIRAEAFKRRLSLLKTLLREAGL